MLKLFTLVNPPDDTANTLPYIILNINAHKLKHYVRSTTLASSVLPFYFTVLLFHTIYIVVVALTLKPINQLAVN